MAKTGRPKVKKPINCIVTAKFCEEEYQKLLKYAADHNLTTSQIVRMGVEIIINSQDNQE